jgi:hypothetical protein
MLSQTIVAQQCVLTMGTLGPHYCAIMSSNNGTSSPIVAKNATDRQAHKVIFAHARA